MEVLNATGLAVVSAHKPAVCAERRAVEPRKLFSVPSFSPGKLPKSVNLEVCPPLLRGGFLLLSNVLASIPVKALTYEEALGQSVSSPLSEGSLDFDVSGLIDGIVKFGVENPPIIAGGLAVLAVPLVLSQVFKKPKPWGVESASGAYAKLSEDPNAQLLDIRGRKEFREVGTPDIRSLKKKPVSIVYERGDKPSFLNRLASKFKEPENTTLFILDKYDGNSELVAELVTLNGFKAAFAIKDGAEGPRGWKNSRLPWIPPKKSFSIDFGELKDVLGDALGDDSDALSLTLGLAAATGLGLLAFTEIETILQLFGSAALVQIVTKKLLFAEDRKKTLKEVDEFLTNKVAPADLLDEIKMIGKVLLTAPIDGKALLPAPAEGSLDVAPATSPAEKPDEVPSVKAEAAVELPQINSVPKAEVKEEPISEIKRSLSPYPYYPDLKPPTSPSPSQP
ncbi:rhodanese-like domain-containing protein 4, chloroplastic [Aristolochia californica]|uniref:rhodanese-like domain-containing protein 4, chloroplastic n=1 Tax=Aristolochia californica TaxID=171875 RepID=UPI0035D93EA5